ncbi:histidine-rich glycoprotein-like [Biomphalaria glabrata]|uniref:Histidine-rich glycoprotein-like n=1 Tax=Biomphalaria glabrata TaxID=6526 RepID=A0A9W3APZ6_BIOGL|nr:histidine-rich glycoprotein-like [Biomphalaria glabrata]
MDNTCIAPDSTTRPTEYGQHMHRTRPHHSHTCVWTTHAQHQTPPLAHLCMDNTSTHKTPPLAHMCMHNTCTAPDPTTRTPVYEQHMHAQDPTTRTPVYGQHMHAQDPTTRTPVYGQHMHSTRPHHSHTCVWTTHAQHQTPSLAHLCMDNTSTHKTHHSHTCVWTTHARTRPHHSHN